MKAPRALEVREAGPPDEDVQERDPLVEGGFLPRLSSRFSRLNVAILSLVAMPSTLPSGRPKRAAATRPGSRTRSLRGEQRTHGSSWSGGPRVTTDLMQ